MAKATSSPASPPPASAPTAPAPAALTPAPPTPAAPTPAALSPAARAARDKLLLLRKELCAQFYERDDVVEGALIALLSRSHLLVLGPPGTAKSQLAQELCGRLDGARYFQWLLTRFSTPEELFGAVSLRALEADDYRRVTDGKLPQAHIAFLDEVFKASSSILNALLSVMNERLFHNGRAPETVPLCTLFGAANELPDEEELRALYDRFLLRYSVDYLQEDFRFLQMLQIDHMAQSTRTLQKTHISLEELDAAASAAASLPIPAGVLQDVAALRRELGKKSIIASDRRYHQAMSALRARAFLAGRDAVNGDDLYLLAHILWTDPEERPQVHASLRELLTGHDEAARALAAEAKSLVDAANRGWDEEEEAVRALVEAVTKLRRLGLRLTELHAEATARGRDVRAIEQARAEVAALEKSLREEHMDGDEQ